MSKTDSPDDEFAEYRGAAGGTEVKTANISSDEHALSGVVDDQERIYDSRITGERFVNFYDSSGAAIREALANAETACIRRARAELRDAGVDSIPTAVSDVIEMADDVAGYEPQVEVTYRRKADDTRFVISDNGIGISTEEYQVVQRVGYSASHMDGSVSGQFGIGWMSMFQLTGVNGAFTMYTKSYTTDESYGTVEYVANFEMLDAERSSYGTTFEFPGFGEAASEIDIPTKVEEYADGMRVPVLYRDFDESGDETSRSDEFLPRNIEDDYPDDALVVTYEDEFFKAVMSPSSKETNDGLVTYNVTMPIRRNTESYGSSREKFAAEWKWDFRGKREDGAIVACESDPNLVGLAPIENSKYDNMIEEQRDDYVPMSRVPDEAIVMPAPASSRDSYMSDHNDFWKYVSKRLQDAWAERAAECFEGIDDWSDVRSMDRPATNAMYRAYSSFAPSYKNNDPDNIAETMQDELGVSLDPDLWEKIDQARTTVLTVNRGSNTAHQKTSCESKKIWKLLGEASDGVYMGKSVSQKKAEIAWGLGDTHVVRVEPNTNESTSEAYKRLESMWGFDKLKDLPSRNLAEKLPELDDDIAEKWENESSSSSTSNSSSSTGTSYRDSPGSRKVTVRYGKDSPRRMTEMRASDIKDKLDGTDGTISIRYNDMRWLILKDQTTISGSTPSTSNASRRDGIAVAAVPKYVYKYLIDADRVVENKAQIKAKRRSMERQRFDEGDVVALVGDDLYRQFEGDVDGFVETAREHSKVGQVIDDDDDVTLRYYDEANNITELEADACNATVVAVGSTSKTAKRFAERHFALDLADVRLSQECPDIDRDSPYFRQIFGYSSTDRLDPTNKDFERAVEIVQEMGGTFPDQ